MHGGFRVSHLLVFCAVFGLEDRDLKSALQSSGEIDSGRVPHPTHRLAVDASGALEPLRPAKGSDPTDRRGSLNTIRLGDNTIEYSKDYKLFITSKSTLGCLLDSVVGFGALRFHPPNPQRIPRATRADQLSLSIFETRATKTAHRVDRIRLGRKAERNSAVLIIISKLCLLLLLHLSP